VGIPPAPHLNYFIHETDFRADTFYIIINQLFKIRREQIAGLYLINIQSAAGFQETLRAVFPMGKEKIGLPNWETVGGIWKVIDLDGHFMSY